MKSNIPHNAPDELLAKFVAGQASETEVAQVEAWANEHPDKRAYLESLMWVWNNSEEVNEADLLETDIAWGQFSKTLEAKDEAKVVEMKQVISRWTWIRVAAVIAVLIAVGVAIIRFGGKSVQNLVAENEREEPKIVYLSDSSRVALNTHSKIEYLRYFDRYERRVKLTGEAFFEVQSHPEQSFIVEVSEVEVKVLGTAFNVREDSSTRSTIIEVKEGRVEVVVSESEKSEILLAGDRAAVNWGNMNISKDRIPMPSVFNWQMDELDFKRKPLNEVIQLLGEVFETEIRLSNPGLGDTLWTSDLRKTSLEVAMKLLQEQFDMPVKKDSAYYKIEPPVVLLD